MCFGCSKEPSRRDGSFKYPQHMFGFRTKKNNFQLRTLIWGPELFCVIITYVRYSKFRSYINDTYVRHAGYNEVADLNDIIILYPQVTSSVTNPNGCWDWFGYTGVTFGEKCYIDQIYRDE